MDNMIFIGAAGVLGLIILVVLLGRFRTASPDRALIISGAALGKKNVFTDESTKNKIKIVRGGGTFVYPIIQQAQELSLLTSKLEVAVSGVYTEKGVPIDADGTVIVKIGSSVEEIATAAEQYLGKSKEDLENEAKEVLEGHLRAILGSMTVEEIYKNRDKFSQEVQNVASGDLAKMGLVIVSFTVKEVKDRNGYLDSLGMPRIAQVKRDADIAKSEATKETRIKVAEDEKNSKRAELERETEIAEANKIKDLKMSAYKQEQDVAKADADNAYGLRKAKLDSELREEQMNVQLVESAKEIELAEKAIIKSERKYDAEVRKKAEADRYAAEQQAEAEKAQAIAKSVAKAKDIELNGKAESESIRAIGKAEAEAKEALAEALKQYGEAALATLLIEKYPEIIKAAADPISNIDKITVIDGGNGNGANSVSGYATKNLVATQEALKDTTGLDLTELIKSAVGNSNVGAKVGELTQHLAERAEETE